MEINVMDLFSGTGSWRKEMTKKGWNVYSLDINPKAFEVDEIINILDYIPDKNKKFDVIIASPPCTQYSKAKTRGIRDLELADSIVSKVLEIIDFYNPKYYLIENPQTGLLPKRPILKHLPYVDCDYCRYGYSYRKRTRFWTNIPLSLQLCEKMCGSIKDGKHIGSCGNGRSKYTDKVYSINDKYSIPPKLIRKVIETIEPLIKSN